MTTFIIYTTAKNSYIVPKEKAKLPKVFTNSFEIDAPYEIVNKKVKLPAKVTKIEDVSGVIATLVHKLTDEEVKEILDGEEEQQ